MDDIEALITKTAAPARADALEMNLEVLVLPVADVARAADFYKRLGWRVDADVSAGGGRLLQLTPPGSTCSIQFGTGLSPSPAGSAQYNYLVVSDIEAAHKELVASGASPTQVFHDRSGGFSFAPASRADGSDPKRRSYASYLEFRDPDGNSWIVQEVTRRFPGRLETGATTFGSAAALAAAMQRAWTAHTQHEKRSGAADADWPQWYAAYMVAEQSGAALPT